jgi:hypothetical protein
MEHFFVIDGSHRKLIFQMCEWLMIEDENQMIELVSTIVLLFLVNVVEHVV